MVTNIQSSGHTDLKQDRIPEGVFRGGDQIPRGSFH